MRATDPGRGWAAVALILTPDPDAVLLIRRAERAGDPWSGQIGLPGGRRGAADAELVHTAIRETAEEVGLDLTGAARLGLLDDVAPRTPVLPLVAVRPFVFAVGDRPPLVLNPEVAAARWVELDRLRRPEAHRPTTVVIRGEPCIVPAILVEEMVVWGMTERILAGFFEATS